MLKLCLLSLRYLLNQIQAIYLCHTYFDLAVTKRLSLPTELRMLSVADFSCKPPKDEYIYFGQVSCSGIVYCLPHSLMLQA
jgi:hypothetical protein